MAAIDPTGWPVPRQVDYRLIGSVLARVRWELDGAPAWRRDPAFYIQQALGPVFDVLLPVPPVSAARADLVIARLGNVTRIVAQAKVNLDDARAPFARLAIDTLADIDTRLDARWRVSSTAPCPATPDASAAPAAAAAAALVDLRRWLESRVAAMTTDTTVGRDAYVRFLREVALVPYTPDEIVRMGRQEWERAVAFEALEQGRNRALPQLPIFPDARAQVTTAAFQEQAIRQFLEREGLLTVPAGVRPLPQSAAAAVSRAAGVPRRHRRPHGPSAPHGRRRQLHSRAAPRPALLLSLDRARSTPDHRARRRARALPAARLVVGAREPDSPALLRLGGQRRHRLLCRGDDAAGGAVAREPALARDHLQLRAPARAARRGRREARHRRVHDSPGRRLPREDRADGPRDGARRGGLVCRGSGPGHHLSDRQAAAHQPARRRAAGPGRAVLAARVSRLHLEERQRAAGVAALGTARRPLAISRP